MARVWIYDMMEKKGFAERVAKAKKAKRQEPMRWQVRWMDPERPGEVLTALRRKSSEAEALRDKIVAEFKAGTYRDPKVAATPFGELAEGWFAGLDEVKRSTLEKYRSVLDTHILPRWKPAPAHAVTAMVIAPWLAKLKKGGGETTVAQEKLGSSQKRQVFTVMSSICDWACPEYMASNPMRDKKKLRRPKRKRIHDHCYLDYLEVEALADAADSLVGAYGRLKAGAAEGINGVLIRTLAYAGLRSGEALALRVGDYIRSRVRPVLRISRTLIEPDKGQLYFDTPKDGEARDAALPLSLVPGIDRLCAGKGPEDLIFSIKGRPVRFGNWRGREFYPARDASDLPKALTPHKLRHTCASLAIAAGATVGAVQRLLGHASATETLNTYYHLWPSEVWTVAEKLNTSRLQAISETAAMDGIVAVVADLARQLTEVRKRLAEIESADGSEALHRELAKVTSGTSEIDGYLRELSAKMDEARDEALAGAT